MSVIALFLYGIGNLIDSIIEKRRARHVCN